MEDLREGSNAFRPPRIKQPKLQDNQTDLHSSYSSFCYTRLACFRSALDILFSPHLFASHSFGDSTVTR